MKPLHFSKEDVIHEPGSFQVRGQDSGPALVQENGPDGAAQVIPVQLRAQRSHSCPKSVFTLSFADKAVQELQSELLLRVSQQRVTGHAHRQDGRLALLRRCHQLEEGEAGRERQNPHTVL
ncbi:hypothetical protein EYF80_035479 [Liparis tanakae]|uniref:Uncharacterized protein n=1 Tax=Liparis tanakae TaxID=230148 RepID=A0A4Z2GLX9_9TELE|nr:hypothetical protein EYF80_035479 [Liparis tanakae]